MAFVPGHKHDIFVSYARVDDQQRWVTLLVRQLKIQLASWLGRSDSYDVWWDRTNLDEAGSIDDQIGTTLRQTALLVAVLSPAYKESKWCKDERRLFLDAVRSLPMSDHRTYLVDMGRLDIQERPEGFSRYLGFEFWKEDELGKRRMLGFPTPDLKKDRDFVDKVDDLAKRVADRLKELRALKEPPPKTRPTVFLAEVPEDLERERNDVVRYLDQREIRVVPQDPYPTQIQACQDAVDSHLRQSVVFAQLLDRHLGKRLAGGPQRLVRLQAERARAIPVKMVQWRSADVDLRQIDDPDHRALLDGDRVRVGKWEEFKSEIVKLATHQREPNGGRRPPEIPFIYVNNSVEDRDLAAELAQILESIGCMSEYQAGNGDPRQFRKEQLRGLVLCNAVIYLYGCVGASWVKEQLRLLRKAVPRRRKPLGIAVCEGPPGQQPPLGVRFPGLQIIDCRAGLAEDAIRSFVQSLRPEAAS